MVWIGWAKDAVALIKKCIQAIRQQFIWCDNISDKLKTTFISISTTQRLHLRLFISSNEKNRNPYTITSFNSAADQNFSAYSPFLIQH